MRFKTPLVLVSVLFHAAFANAAACEVSVAVDGIYFNPNRPAATQWIALAAQDAEVIDLGRVPAGSGQFLDLKFRIANAGTAAATLGALASSSAEFSLPEGPASVSPAGSAVLTVRFTPDKAGEKTSTVSFTACGQAYKIKVAGLGSEGK